MLRTNSLLLLLNLSMSLSVSLLLLLLLLPVLFFFVMFDTLIIMKRLYGRPAWSALGFSGRPLTCLLTIFALLYCEWQIYVIDGSILCMLTYLHASWALCMWRVAVYTITACDGVTLLVLQKPEAAHCMHIAVAMPYRTTDRGQSFDCVHSWRSSGEWSIVVPADER